MEFNVFTIGFIVSFKSNLGPEWRTIINPHLRTYFVHENPEVTVAKSCSHFFLSFSANTSPPPPQTTLYMYIILHRRRSHQMILPATFAYMHTYITRTRVYFKRATHRQTPTRVHVCARPSSLWKFQRENKAVSRARACVRPRGHLAHTERAVRFAVTCFWRPLKRPGTPLALTFYAPTWILSTHRNAVRFFLHNNRRTDERASWIECAVRSTRGR